MDELNPADWRMAVIVTDAEYEEWTHEDSGGFEVGQHQGTLIITRPDETVDTLYAAGAWVKVRVERHERLESTSTTDSDTDDKDTTDGHDPAL